MRLARELVSLTVAILWLSTHANAASPYIRAIRIKPTNYVEPHSLMHAPWADEADYDTICTTEGCYRIRRRQPLSLDRSSTGQWIVALREGTAKELLEGDPRAVPILLAAMRDDRARSWTGHMLIFHRGDTEWLVPVYAAALGDSSTLLRDKAVAELSRHKTKLAPFRAQIVAALKESAAAKGFDFFRVQYVIAACESLEIAKEDRVTILQTIYQANRTDDLHRYQLQGVLDHLPFDAENSLDVVLNIVDGLEREEDLPRAWSRAGPVFAKKLIAELEGQDQARRRAAALLLAKQTDSLKGGLIDDADLQKLLHHLRDEDEHVRTYLLETLEHHRRLGDDAIPLLAACLSDAANHNQYRAGRVLGKYCPAALPAMRTAALSKNPVERLGAVVAFRYCEALAEADAELLLALLKDDDAAVRSYAMFAVQGRDGYKARIEAILIPMLDEPKLQAFALESLVRVVSKNSPGFDKLMEALPEAPPQQRVWLAMAIRRIDPESQVALQTLTALLRETESPSGLTYHSSKLVHSQRINTWHASQRSVAASAAEYLAEIGAAAAPAVPQLIAALESKERDLRSNAIEALGSIGPAARAAIEPLRELLASDEWTRAAALDALCKIDPEGGWEKQRPSPFVGISVSESNDRADGSSAAAKTPGK